MHGQKIKRMAEQKKYVFVGDGESVHLLKWVKEIVKYFDVFVISSQGFLLELEEIIPTDKLFSLQINVKQDGVSFGYLSKVRSVKKLLKQINPDFVNAHYISSHGLLIALSSIFSKPKYTFIASAWGTDVLVFPWKNKLFFLTMKLILSKADWLTSDSEYMSTVIKKIKKREVLTFTFGLNKLPKYDDAQYNENLYFSNRGLTPNYNIARVLKVFSTIYKQNNKAHLLVSNQGAEKENLVKLCVDLGIEKAVDFVGFLNEKDQIDVYTKACCYFSLPISDSTSVSLLEALAYGCIPILSDIPANKEWVKDGVNGLIIKQDISYEKLKALKDNRKQIAESNRKTIAEKAIFPDSMRQFVQNICGT